MEQLTIFDWMPSLTGPYPDINDITEAEAVQIVSGALGLKFAYSERFREWQAKKGKLKLAINYGHFDLEDNHELFLGTSWESGTSGGAAPCSGIGEAIKWFKRKMSEAMK